MEFIGLLSREMLKEAIQLKSFSVLLIFGLAGCADRTHDGIYSDDSALAGDDKFYETGFVGNNSAEDGLSIFTVEQISGAETIWDFEAQGGETVTLNCSLDENKGRQLNWC